MIIKPLLHGFLLTFGLITPLGPQNMFIFSQGTEAKRIKDILPLLIVVSLCDTMLILAAILGVSGLIFEIPQIKYFMVLAGFFFLIYMGYLNFKNRNKPIESTNTISRKKKLLYAISISILNPHAIIDTIGVIGTSALSYQGKSKIIFTIACVIMSWGWFFMLAILGKKLGNFTSIRKKINIFSAIVMWLSAIIILKTGLSL